MLLIIYIVDLINLALTASGITLTLIFSGSELLKINSLVLQKNVLKYCRAVQHTVK